MRQQTPENQAPVATRTPIFLRGGTRPIGYVDGDTFRKTIAGSKHLLRRPRAIAMDVSTIDDAESAGATRVAVTDSETGSTYVADIDTIKTRGFTVARGHNRQIALTLPFWNVNSQPADAERRAATTNAARKRLQLALLGGSEE